MGKILKIRQFGWLNFISTYRAWVCVQKILWFCMSMKSAVTQIQRWVPNKVSNTNDAFTVRYHRQKRGGRTQIRGPARRTCEQAAAAAATASAAPALTTVWHWQQQRWQQKWQQQQWQEQFQGWQWQQQEWQRRWWQQLLQQRRWQLQRWLWCPHPHITYVYYLVAAPAVPPPTPPINFIYLFIYLASMSGYEWQQPSRPFVALALNKYTYIYLCK